MSINLLAASFWDQLFPKGPDGKFHFLLQVSSMIVITIILSIIIIAAGIRMKKVDPLKKTPMWLVPFVWVVEIVNNFCKSNIGKRWKPFACYFTTLGIFMCVLNISSVFGFTTPTSYMVLNFAFAIITFLMIQITGIRSLGIKGYLKSFVGPVKWLSPLLIPMNIVSEIALPISLTLRLMGNVLSGSVVSKIVMGSAGWFSLPFMPILNGYFDLMSGVIQTLVFVMLSVIFLSMKIDDSEKIYD